GPLRRAPAADAFLVAEKPPEGRGRDGLVAVRKIDDRSAPPDRALGAEEEAGVDDGAHALHSVFAIAFECHRMRDVEVLVEVAEGVRIQEVGARAERLRGGDALVDETGLAERLGAELEPAAGEAWETRSLSVADAAGAKELVVEDGDG